MIAVRTSQLSAPPKLVLLSDRLEPRAANEQAIATAHLSEDVDNFPRHMLLWSLVGIVAYFGAIASAMIYAALLSAT
jgi:hypothetical protein